MNESDDIQLQALVASFLNELPSDKFKNLNLTLSQVFRWNLMRRKSSLQARHWSSILNLENDPLDNLEKEGCINQRERLGITLYVSFYQRLWELIQSSEGLLSKFCEQKNIHYPFASHGNRSSAYLLIEILKGIIDGKFQNCLNPDYKFSAEDLNKLAAYVLRVNEPRPQEKNEVLAIAKAETRPEDTYWFNLLFYLCEHKSKQNPIIKMRFDAVCGSIEQIAEYHKTITETGLDTTIYDDPNILVGDRNESPHFSILKLKSLISKRPPWEEPPQEGMAILRKWVASSEGQQWCEEWDYLASLSIDDYVWMYAHFPDPFLKDFIDKKHNGYELYKEIKTYHEGTSCWLLWLPYTDRPKALILESKELINFELDSKITNARLGIAQQIIDNPLFRFGEMFNRNPACLWFWWEVAYCTDKLKTCGLVKPIHLKKIKSKRQVHNEAGLYLDFMEDTANGDKISFQTIKGFNLASILDNLPGIIESVSAQIAATDTTFQDACHDPYTKLRRTRRNQAKNSKDYQLSYLYLSNERCEPELFTTRSKQKLPGKC